MVHVITVQVLKFFMARPAEADRQDIIYKSCTALAWLKVDLPEGL